VSGSFYGLEPSGLYASGVSVGDLEGDARSAASGFLTAISEAEGAVHHPVVAGALRSYHGTWSPKANNLPVEVSNTGARISNVATTGVQYANQAADPLRSSLLQQQAQSPFLAAACAEDGDADGARRALQCGLVVAPAAEDLWRDALRQAQQLGSRADVRAVADGMYAAVARHGSPRGVTAETEALVDELLPGYRRSAA